MDVQRTGVNMYLGMDLGFNRDVHIEVKAALWSPRPKRPLHFIRETTLAHFISDFIARRFYDVYELVTRLGFSSLSVKL